jgi:hypothetical protein
MSRLFSFVGAGQGDWTVTRQQAIAGEALPAVRCVTVAAAATAPAGAWALRGITSNERYVERHEKTQLLALQPGLGRPEARCAALIPIRKSAAWWALTQDERRAVFEAQSQHTAIGLKYLPAIARRLHHCRDMGEAEPFDFVTWFEFAPEHAGAFDDLLAALRASPEWTFVDREVDIRLSRGG